MRRYSVLMDMAEGEAHIIFRDDEEALDEWFVFEKNVHGGNAKTIVEALNAAEREQARRTV